MRYPSSCFLQAQRPTLSRERLPRYIAAILATSTGHENVPWSRKPQYGLTKIHTPISQAGGFDAARTIGNFASQQSPFSFTGRLEAQSANVSSHPYAAVRLSNSPIQSIISLRSSPSSSTPGRLASNALSLARDEGRRLSGARMAGVDLVLHKWPHRMCLGNSASPIARLATA